MRGYYYMVIYFGLSVFEVETDSPVVVVRHRFYRGVQKDVIGREAFHHGVDVGFCTVFES